MATPRLPFKTRLQIIGYSVAIDFSRRSNYTINRRISNLLDPKAPPSTKCIHDVTVTSSDVTVDPSRNLWFRLYVPTVADGNRLPIEKLPVFVYSHGGGFTFFSANTKPFDDLCYRLAASLPAVVVSVNYRLVPEHRCPAQYDDVYDVLKFIDAHGHECLPPAADLGKCFIAGDSAGGNITHHVTVRASRNDEDPPALQKLKIVGQVLIQPFFGGEERTEAELRLDKKVPLVNIERADWAWKAFLPDGADRNHEAANVIGTNQRIGVKFPATAIVVGGFDPLQDWQKRYIDWLTKCGKQVEMIEYPKAIHAFYGFPELPEFELFINDLKKFVQKQSSSS